MRSDAPPCSCPTSPTVDDGACTQQPGACTRTVRRGVIDRVPLARAAPSAIQGAFAPWKHAPNREMRR